MKLKTPKVGDIRIIKKFAYIPTERKEYSYYRFAREAQA